MGTVIANADSAPNADRSASEPSLAPDNMAWSGAGTSMAVAKQSGSHGWCSQLVMSRRRIASVPAITNAAV